MAVPLVEHKLRLLPDKPGCYEMLNYAGKIIYVGKSKDLKHRVRSYFKSSHTGKVAKMVSEVRNFHTIYVSTDKEAFLLEITLIQKYRPYFNIQLKQGHESYPYLKITNQRNPHLKVTRVIKNDGADYFGPYPVGSKLSLTLHFLQYLYPLKRCYGHHQTPCLYYHMGLCLGGCFKHVPRSVYQLQIHHIKTFLNGNYEPAKRILITKMHHHAKHLQFEKAEHDKQLLHYIKKTVAGQKIISHDFTPRDVFNYYANDGWECIQILLVREARIMRRLRYYIPIMNTPADDALLFLIQFYKSHSAPNLILVPKQLPNDVIHESLHTTVKTPLRGQRRAMLMMAYQNAKISLQTKFRLLLFNHTRYKHGVQQLSKKLGIPYAKYIDSFDLAYLQGRDIVGGCIVYKDGKPDKQLYRRYKIHTGHADEYGGMTEMLSRRYSHLLRDHKQLPNLILQDGGIIQLKSAQHVLHKLGLHIPVAGMVKDARHRTRNLLYAFPHQSPQLLPVDRKSSGFFLLTRIQTDVHNFIINYHRHVHDKSEIHSELDLIPGVGAKTRNKLLRHFGAVKNIANASVQDIKKLGIPIKTAQTIKFSLNTH